MPPPTSKRHYRPFLQRLVLASRHGSKSLARARERRPSGTPASRFESNNPTNPRPLTLRSNGGWEPGGGETRVGNRNERGVRDEPARRGEARRGLLILRSGRRGHGAECSGSAAEKLCSDFRIWFGRRGGGGAGIVEADQRRGEESNPTGLGLPRVPARLGVPWCVFGSKWPSALIDSRHTRALFRAVFRCLIWAFPNYCAAL
jgi:hypothetical protein